jgi:ATPase subunit of ABC transporter with duplicated ATPase domains
MCVPYTVLLLAAHRFLADFKGTVVAVTHDRYFLDNVGLTQ